jgi:hypothetical protein
MTTITLPPDLEHQIAERARQRGTTPELLAIDGLRQLFAQAPSTEGTGDGETLFDFLDGFIATVDGTAEGLADGERRDRP